MQAFPATGCALSSLLYAQIAILDEVKSTQLGYGLGLALGAKMAAPEKHVINVMGDAAFGMAGLDIETAVRSEIPILTIVLNNGIMTHYDKYMPYASKHWASNKLSGDYAKVADGLGAYTETVHTPDELPVAIQRAIAANEEGRTRGATDDDQRGGNRLSLLGNVR